MYLRKGYGAFSAGTRVDVGDTFFSEEHGMNMVAVCPMSLPLDIDYYELVPPDHLESRRDRTREAPLKNRAARRAEKRREFEILNSIRS